MKDHHLIKHGHGTVLACTCGLLLVGQSRKKSHDVKSKDLHNEWQKIINAAAANVGAAAFKLEEKHRQISVKTRDIFSYDFVTELKMSNIQSLLNRKFQACVRLRNFVLKRITTGRENEKVLTEDEDEDFMPVKN